MNSYNKSYLADAVSAFASMMDYAVNACRLDGDVFLHMFITCGLAEKFEHGNPKVVLGMSGFELAYKAIADTTGKIPTALPFKSIDFRTPEYWAGWALCQYQWHSARSFASILRFYPFAEIVAGYYPLHEADITKFYAIAEETLQSDKPTNQSQADTRTDRILTGCAC